MVNEKNIKFLVLESANDDYLMKVAELHTAHLSYRSFITVFGVNFIKEIYKDILLANIGFLILAFSRERIVGFTLGCTNSNLIFVIIRNKYFKYLKITVKVLLRRPYLIFKVFETLLYNKKENTHIAAELVVIATDNDYRSKGLGTKLVQHLNTEFTKRGIHEYKVTVHDEMKQSNNFYLKNGMKLINSFIMYKVKWNLYEYKIKNNE